MALRRKRRRGGCGPPMLVSGIIALALAFGLVLGLRETKELYYDAAYPIQYEELVTQYCKEYQVDEALVYAVIKNESGFHPDAVSSVDARGLMQIQGPTLEWAVYREGKNAKVTEDDLFTPEVNIKYGVLLLSLFLEEFHSPEVALCCYHAGWGNVKKWLKDPDYSSDGVTLKVIPFKDTATYVSRVMGTMEQYQQRYDLTRYQIIG